MMKNKIVLITGSTDGIGKQTALNLASMNAEIIIHGRSDASVRQTLKELEKNGHIKLTGIAADLSSLDQVRQFASRIKSDFERIDVLINNAGVYMKDRVLSKDGFEMTFAVNHLAHFLLTAELLPLLRNSDGGRIINVSSIAHQNGKLEWDNLNGEKRYDAYGAYAMSKLANVLFSRELAERIKGMGVTSNSLHPGVISTKLLRTGFNISGASVAKGAENSVYLASSETLKSISGKYFVDKRISGYHALADDLAVRKRFWDLSNNFTGRN